MAAAVSKVWHLLPHDREAVERLARSLSISPIVAQLLHNRGLDDPTQAKRFMLPSLSGLHPPDMLPGVTQAADRIHAAIKERRSICIYGDYDVDGISGSSLLLQCLRLAGANVDVYVPHRLDEGYGVNKDALRQLAQRGTSLVVTVDCGITSVEEAKLARELGLEFIVTDHHEFKDTLPDATVLVHPRLPGTNYPFDKLSGSAVAFKLAWAVAQRACGSDKVTEKFKDYLVDAVTLASLGVVADVVPLIDENRIFVRQGLARLQSKPPLGLQMLCATSGMEPGHKIRASDIGYRLAPRMNAAGRLGCARLVIELLSTTDAQRAKDISNFLDTQNTQRQTLEREMTKQARDLVETTAFRNMPALVLAQPNWHGGVIGIVASRLVEAFARPVLMIAMRKVAEGTPQEELIGFGSGRSIPGFSLHEALRACERNLLAHGGHKAAAGFRLKADRIDAFRADFCAYAEKQFPAGPPTPTLKLDAEVPLSALTLRVVEELDRLEPYGAENPRPLFLAGDLTIEGEPRKVGKGEKTLQFRVRQNQTVMKAVAFNKADRVEELMSAGGHCCLAFTPVLNHWQGRTNVEMEVADWQPGSQARLG